MFPNPEFAERQRLRLSTSRTPRVIGCFERRGRFLALPRALATAVEELLADLGMALELADERTTGSRVRVRFRGRLSSVQERAARAMLETDVGVLCAPPGSGKTVIATRLIAARGRSTLVLVHRKPLLEQWLERLGEFLDTGRDGIGTIGGGKRGQTTRIDVAMVQTLARAEGVEGLLSGYGHIVVDECHHVPAVMTERVLAAAPARYVTGLTATPQRRDGHDPIIAWQCGPVRHRIDSGTQTSAAGLALRVVARETAFDGCGLPVDASIQEVYTALVRDEQRTDLIASDARALVGEGRSPIVLTERRENLDCLRGASSRTYPR
jgi:hypothetical protein